MNILFDISVLGTGHFSAQSRTGIFRVVEHIALGLNSVEDSRTVFCSSHNNFNNCRKYLKSIPSLCEADFSKPSDLLSSFYNNAEPLRLEISKLPQQPWKIPFRKIYNYGRKYIHTIDEKDISIADIYHSPFHALPDQLVVNKNIVKFVTIHDLIPFICPQYCHHSAPDFMKTVLNSIKDDTFVICVSEATKRDLLSYMPLLDPEKVFVTYLAAGNHFYPCNDDSQINMVRKKYKIPIEGEYLLALGALQPRKNFERIIRSYIEVIKNEHISDLCLVLVGPDSWDYGGIYSEIKGAGDLAGKIILTGYVPDEDLAPLYSRAMAFLYPSFYEGFGLPPLEAMQCGTPVITSNISSLPEVVGYAGIMIDPNDGDALCQEMLNIYKSSKLRAKLSAASIERAKSFSWDKTTKETFAAYRKALSYK